MGFVIFPGNKIEDPNCYILCIINGEIETISFKLGKPVGDLISCFLEEDDFKEAVVVLEGEEVSKDFVIDDESYLFRITLSTPKPGFYSFHPDYLVFIDKNGGYCYINGEITILSDELIYEKYGTYLFHFFRKSGAYSVFEKTWCYVQDDKFLLVTYTNSDHDDLVYISKTQQERLKKIKRPIRETISTSEFMKI